MARAGRAPAFFAGAVLVLSLGLNAYGVRWGLPNIYTWAQDEIIPAEVLEGQAKSFSNGWHSRYPPFHYYLMSAAYAPVRWLSPPMAVSAESVAYERAFVAGRGLSLAMAGGTLALLFLCGRELGDSGAGATAALLLALSPTFVYYAKFANLDVPYLFWFALSMLFLLRFSRRRAVRDALGLALAAAAAVVTKDQAYALYVLLVPILLIQVGRDRAAARLPNSPIALAADRRLVLPALAALAVFAFGHNLPANPAGFAEHVRLITGDASRDYRMFEKTAFGEWQLLSLSVRQLVFVIGVPGMLLAIAGVAWALAAPARGARWLVLLLPIASYHLLFLAVVLYAYDRFLLPAAFVLSLFGGLAACVLLRSGTLARLIGIAAIAGVLGYGLARTVSLDDWMARDTRYAVEAWFDDNVPKDARIALLGPLEYLPRLAGFKSRQRTELVRAIERMQPDYVVVNLDFASRSTEPRASELYDRLASGELGYRVAFEAASSSEWPYRLDLVVRAETERTPTNLDKISPRMRVYAREPR